MANSTVKMKVKTPSIANHPSFPKYGFNSGVVSRQKQITLNVITPVIILATQFAAADDVGSSHRRYIFRRREGAGSQFPFVSSSNSIQSSTLESDYHDDKVLEKKVVPLQKGQPCNSFPFSKYFSAVFVL